MTVPAGPVPDGIAKRPPAAEVEIADTEIGTFAKAEGLQQRGKEGFLNVVENARHGGPVGGAFPFLPTLIERNCAPTLGGLQSSDAR